VRCISVPCDPDSLRSILERSGAVLQKIRHSEHLPVPDDLSCLQAPDIQKSLHQLSDLIRVSQALPRQLPRFSLRAFQDPLLGNGDTAQRSLDLMCDILYKVLGHEILFLQVMFLRLQTLKQLRDLILQRLLRFLRLRRSVPGTSWLLLSLSRPAGLCSAIRRFLRLSFAAGLRSHIAAPDPPHQIFLSLLSETLHPQEQDQQGCARQDLSTDHPHTE